MYRVARPDILDRLDRLDRPDRPYRLDRPDRLEMKEAVEKIVKALVGDPESVEITERTDGSKVIKYGVRVAPDDFGRLIGREGRTIKAIRSVLYFGGHKQGKRFHLDLIED